MSGAAGKPKTGRRQTPEGKILEILRKAVPRSKIGSAMRIAVINSHPIQYFAPLYAYLNAATDLDVTALYLSDVSIRGGRDVGFGQDVKWDLDLLAGYRSLFLGDAARRREQ